MCGWLEGISGFPSCVTGKKELSTESWRLCFSVVASILLHCGMLALEDVAGTLQPQQEGGLYSQRRGGTIDVLINSPSTSEHLVTLSDERAAEVMHPGLDSAKEALSSGGRMSSFGLMDDRSPVLLEDIDFDVGDPRVAGFMILRLDISIQGSVVLAQAVYSDLPESVQADIVRRFSAAVFSPAKAHGEVVPATVLLKVEVE